jgi:anti-sigma-K factor RskA
VNIQEYIASGKLEACVLGMASQQELQELEQLCQTYPEVKEAKEAFELQLEATAMTAAMPAPAHLKEKIWQQLEMPVPATQPGIVKTFSFYKYAAAAAIILLVSSIGFNWYFYNKYQSSLAQYNSLYATTQQMAKNSEAQQTKLGQYENTIQLLSNPAYVPVTLNGQPVAPSSLATVYWNKQTAEVFLLSNNLPAPNTDMQYQLWAIVDGVPVNAGFIDITTGKTLVKCKNISSAQAFAITLEKKGRTDITTPQGAIHVLGKI